MGARRRKHRVFRRVFCEKSVSYGDQHRSVRNDTLAVTICLYAGREKLIEELRRVIVGQDSVIEEIIIVLFSGSHCLITGAPGLAKTLLIRSIARILDLQFKRIQFTPDLMPSDIVGTEIIDEDLVSGHRELRFIPGPIFTNILLADEINRTPPKTQAALLEAMEEKQVTIAGELRPLDPPFYVLATTTSDLHNEPHRVFTGDDMLDFARLVRMVPIADPVARYAVRLVQASRPDRDDAPDFVKNWISWGAGTRGTQNLILGAKTRALLNGRFHVSCADIRAMARPVLRHRILTNFHAEADRIGVEDVIAKLLETVAEPKSGLS
jgi:MoxR-like ATPase